MLYGKPVNSQHQLESFQGEGPEAQKVREEGPWKVRGAPKKSDDFPSIFGILRCGNGGHWIWRHAKHQFALLS